MTQHILVLNCGSSSLKYAVVDPQNPHPILEGQAENIGQENAVVSIEYKGNKQTSNITNADHKKALLSIIDLMESPKKEGVDIDIVAVGHRVVHGGERFNGSVLINEEVIKGIEACAKLAPLHNPAQLQGILTAQEVFNVPHIAVFDTAFHQTMPKEAYLYPLPYDAYKKHGVRVYGFHGSSFRYINDAMKATLRKENPDLVVAHLGNGGSLCAIAGGKAVDTTMGITPLGGVVHGTRCGDIDPSIPEFLSNALDLNTHQVSDMLWKKSGLLGISGISHDCRTLEALKDREPQAKLALTIYAYRLAKHIGAMQVAVGKKLDALVFTGGIGENSAYIRSLTLKQFAFMGIAMDEKANEATFRGASGIISTPNSTTDVWVIPTNEELIIARDCASIINKR